MKHPFPSNISTFLLLDQKKVPKKNQEISEAIGYAKRKPKAKTSPRLRRFLTPWFPLLRIFRFLTFVSTNKYPLKTGISTQADKTQP